MVPFSLPPKPSAMALRADLSVYDADGRLTALAEVKNRTGTSGQWAAKTRRNLLAHGYGWGSDFFLLITPDRLYAWKDAGDEPLETPPTYEADLAATFASYFHDAGLAANQINGPAFELVVAAWLNDLMGRSNANACADHDWLDRSGFRAAVKDGRIEVEGDM